MSDEHHHDSTSAGCCATETDHDVIVVGGGVAGLSAALMLGRSRRRTLVLDAGRPRNRFAAHMQAVLGSDGKAPEDLLATGIEELRAYDVEVRRAQVTAVATDDRTVTVHTAEGDRITARALVAASGVSDQLPDVPGLSQRWGRSVLHCPYCHGWEVRDRALGVVFTSPLAPHQVPLVRQLSADVTAFFGGFDDGTGSAGAPVELTAELRQRLQAREVKIVTEPVVALHGEGGDLSEVELSTGARVPVEAIFTGAELREQAAYLDGLGLRRAQSPFGEFLEVDPMGHTSNPRIFATGNLTVPTGNVPMSLGAAATTGAGVNHFLAEEDFDDAQQPDRFWENRYGASAQSWSGNPNAALVAEAGDLAPDSSLDLGCGEGADVIWLAGKGWQATGVDISTIAVDRARKAAAAAGVADRTAFSAVDLRTFDPGRQFDLVTASFLHSPVDLPRTEILRRAVGWVAPGGRLLVISHQPGEHHRHHLDLPTVDAEVTALDLPDEAWSIRKQVIPRTVTRPDGTEIEHCDGIVEFSRRAGTSSGT
ncbi:SAM-dependent methyltransferase [Naumannella halotolerans]|nr:SAM-dependent methyltransferase [Naumannella halotolerans]